MNRRDVLRLATLSALAVAGSSALAGCGSSSSNGSGIELVSSKVARRPGDPGDVAGVVTGLHRLGGGLLGHAPVADDANLAVSPFSVGVALAMTLNGAVGQTRTQMLDLFGSASVTTLNSGLDALTTYADSVSATVVGADGKKQSVVLAPANTIFGQRGEDWKQPFLDTLARSYGAGLQAVDYRTDADGATREINTWTADNTHDRITDIIPPGTLDDSTRIVLVNALYLKAPWESPFDTSVTQEGTFTRPDGSTVRAQLMQGTGPTAPLVLGRGDGWAGTRVPYAGGKLAMSIVLPDRGRFDDVWSDIVAGHLPTYLDAMKPALVELTLPRWTFRTQVELSKPLMALGMTDAFGEAADFSGMTDTDQLEISQVLHQVYVAVDEGGTEAAAATAVVGVAASAVGPSQAPYRLVCDRPFVFVLHDVAHGTPLFVGRVTDPTAA